MMVFDTCEKGLWVQVSSIISHYYLALAILVGPLAIHLSSTIYSTHQTPSNPRSTPPKLPPKLPPSSPPPESPTPCLSLYSHSSTPPDPDTHQRTSYSATPLPSPAPIRTYTLVSIFHKHNGLARDLCPHLQDIGSGGSVGFDSGVFFLGMRGEVGRPLT